MRVHYGPSIKKQVDDAIRDATTQGRHINNVVITVEEAKLFRAELLQARHPLYCVFGPTLTARYMSMYYSSVEIRWPA